MIRYAAIAMLGVLLVASGVTIFDQQKRLRVLKSEAVDKVLAGFRQAANAEPDASQPESLAGSDKT